MTALKNDRFLRALLKQPVDVTPVWMMRQAGRYLPEYRATRAKAGDFMSLCMNPELACEVTLQPLDRYPQLDAAILFSDILTIPDAMGQGLYFETGEGPRFRKVVSSLADIEALPVPDPEQDLGYVMDAVRTIRRELNGRVPLIGFSGSPWTLATYMVEGGSSKDFRKSKAMLYDNPKAMHALLDKLAQSVTSYLNGQIRAGAQAVQIFDSWGGSLSAAAYQEFSPRRSRADPGGLRQGYGACVQSRPRHYPGSRPGPCRRLLRGGARAVGAVPRLSRNERRGAEAPLFHARADGPPARWLAGSRRWRTRPTQPARLNCLPCRCGR